MIFLGIAGAVFALGYAAVKFRSRGDQKASVFLIHTRVAAQVRLFCLRNLIFLPKFLSIKYNQNTTI